MKFCCFAKAAGEADDGEHEDEDDGKDVGMVESLHSTWRSSALPAGGVGAAATPGVTVMAAEVMARVAAPPSFLVLADAWQ